ncbi:MAG: NUDIX hydrolase [Hyphomicrobium sp.]|uniref:NUDIX hydrolase n=1 Tax=Hyphomicrobium sp. TaxID=82 RepID=UPI0039E3F7BA
MTLRQVGALPLRKLRGGGVEVLLVSSRETGRWVIPKGWPAKRLSDAKAAAREAKQEAGVSGKMKGPPIGSYRYRKRMPGGIVRVIDVDVYVLWVKKERKSWPEKDERVREWFAQSDAARLVREPKLKVLIGQFAV